MNDYKVFSFVYLQYVFLRNIISANENGCTVTLHGNNTVGKGCKTEESDCGFAAGEYKVCCCNTSNCNDDAFVEKCKKGALSSTPSKPKDLWCFNSRDRKSSFLSGDFAEKCPGKFICSLGMW